MIVSGIIFAWCALIMIVIGIFQLKSKEPVGFYTGEKPPAREEIKDVAAWNRKHGVMWIVYGVIIIISWICGYLAGDSLWCLIPFFAGVIGPLPVMIWYHHRLIKMYKEA